MGCQQHCISFKRLKVLYSVEQDSALHSSRWQIFRADKTLRHEKLETHQTPWSLTFFITPKNSIQQYVPFHFYPSTLQPRNIGQKTGGSNTTVLSIYPPISPRRLFTRKQKSWVNMEGVSVFMYGGERQKRERVKIIVEWWGYSELERKKYSHVGIGSAAPRFKMTVIAITHKGLFLGNVGLDLFDESLFSPF